MLSGTTDPLHGNARRNTVLMAAQDATRLSLHEGDAVMLRSPTGELLCTVWLARCKPGTLQVYWPEGNVWPPPRAWAPISKEPDYNTHVVVEPVKA